MSSSQRPPTPPPPLEPLLLPLPPPPPSDRYKKVEEYVELLREENAAYIAELQQEAQAIFAKRGPLCDSEGFYQHAGECWNDVFQQILFNADSIKEEIQYQMIHHTFDTVAESLHDTLFVPSHEKTMYYIQENYEEIQLLKQWMSLYIREIQKRFLRHYITEATRRTLKEEVCAREGKEPGEVALKEIAEVSKRLRARKQGAEGIRAAIFGKMNYRGRTLQDVMYHKTIDEHKEDIVGGSLFDILLLTNVINAIFFPGDGIHIHAYTYEQVNFEAMLKSSRAEFESVLEEATGVYVGLQNPIAEGKGHAIGFLKCGGTHYIYDDNFGSIEFRWDIFLRHLLDIMETGRHPVVKFVRIYFKHMDSTENLFFLLYPILEFMDVGKVRRVLLFDEEFIEIPAEARKFEFERGAIRVVGKINRSIPYVIDDFGFLGRNTSEPSNQNFRINYKARIGQPSLFRYISFGDEALALDYIEKNPVDPELTYREEGKGMVPVLFMAIIEGMEKVAIALVEKGYKHDFIVDRYPAIAWAIVQNMPYLFRVLLEKKSMVEFKSHDGKSLLHFAASHENPAFVQELLKSGADINVLTNSGRTPLFYAVNNGHAEVVKVLCAAGADASIRDLGNPEKGTPPSTAEGYAKSDDMKQLLATCGLKKGGNRKTRRRQSRNTTKRVVKLKRATASRHNTKHNV